MTSRSWNSGKKLKLNLVIKKSRNSLKKYSFKFYENLDIPTYINPTFLGDKFDLREFHDAVLLESAIPMSILEELIDQYINNHK